MERYVSESDIEGKERRHTKKEESTPSPSSRDVLMKPQKSTQRENEIVNGSNTDTIVLKQKELFKTIQGLKSITTTLHRR